MAATLNGLAAAGSALYEALAVEYDISPVNEALVMQACRLADQLDRVTEALETAPMVTVNAKGEEVAQPLLGELRQLTTAMRGVWTTLGVKRLDAHHFPRSSATNATIAKGRERAAILAQVRDLNKELADMEAMDAFLAGELH